MAAPDPDRRAGTPERGTPAGAALGAHYVGRFAPSPTGPLHRGSLLAALGSWLDARAHGGTWLVRIEDVDTTRCRAEAEGAIMAQLSACGLHPDGLVLRQSERGDIYQGALDALLRHDRAYACGCSRQDLQRAGARIYPGTCRRGLGGRPARAWRLRLPDAASACLVHWEDARLGALSEQVDQQVGDFVLKRADGPWAYQLAVVVDDAAQGITHVVRGEDLAGSTARQILLQRALGVRTPRYLHLPLVRDALGRKLSKSEGAQALVPGPNALREAAHALGLQVEGRTVADVLQQALQAWRAWRRLEATAP